MQNKRPTNLTYLRFPCTTPAATCALLVAALLYQSSAGIADDDKPQLLELPSAPADNNAPVQRPQPAPLPSPGANASSAQPKLLPLPDASATPPGIAAVPAAPVVPGVPATAPVSPQPLLPTGKRPAPPPPTTVPTNSIPSPTATNTAPASSAATPAEFGKAIDSDHGNSSSHDPDLSLMFTPEEMAAITKMFHTFDNYDEHKAAPTAKDSITDIFGNDNVAPQVAPQAVRLPNVYCGSIVYYSPQNWLVTANGVKLTSANNNTPGSEFHVSAISRKEVVIVWKPHSLNDVPDKWNQKTDAGKNSLPNIAVDAANGIITLHMRPNQTFIPDTLEIREGLIKSKVEAANRSLFRQVKDSIGSATTSGK